MRRAFAVGDEVPAASEPVGRREQRAVVFADLGGVRMARVAVHRRATDRVVVEGEQHKSKSKTKTPPQSKINKTGWNFKKYNRGSSGTNRLASLSVLSSPQLLRREPPNIF